MTNDIANAWGSVNTEDNGGGSSQKKERPEFMKLSLGDNKVRLLDMIPYSYNEWYSPKADGGKGASIPYFGKEDLLEKANQEFMNKIFAEADAKGLKDKDRKDFLRDQGYKKTPYGKLKSKHIIHVLDRATGEVKLLDKGNGIFKLIKKLATNPEYGDPRNYDITITMEDTEGKGNFQDIEYTVTPARQNTELTAAEKALYEEKKIDLKEFKTPNYTPEQAKLIADGATFQDVLGKNADGSDAVAEKSNPDMLPSNTPEPPQQEEERSVEPPKEEPAPPVVGRALSPEELEGIDFGE